MFVKCLGFVNFHVKNDTSSHKKRDVATLLVNQITESFLRKINLTEINRFPEKIILAEMRIGEMKRFSGKIKSTEMNHF